MNHDAGGYGAIWVTESNGDKEIFVSHNNSGEIYRIDDYETDSPSATLIFYGQITNNNDGASCPAAPPPVFPELPTVDGGGSSLCAAIPDPADTDVMVRFINQTDSTLYLIRVGDEQYVVEDGVFTSMLIPLPSGETSEQETSLDEIWQVYATERPYEADEALSLIHI